MNSKREVKANDFKKQYSSIKKEIDSAIKKVLQSGWYILGSEVTNFEKELASYLHVKYAVGVASGTDALTIALKAIGIKSGDGVVLPANVYPTSFGVALSGATIQLADIDAETLNISIDSIKKAVTKKTKAILLVHLYGNPVPDLIKIKNYAKQNKLLLIEDCAQAIGAEYKGKKVGSFGDISCFSFYPTKNLGAVGDGGAITTNNIKFFQQVKLWRTYGERERYKSEIIGLNSRLDELQAAILSVKLKHLDSWNKRRREIASKYSKGLKDLPLEMVSESKDGKSCFHLFVIRSKERHALNSYLKEKGIGVGIHYPATIHKTPSFSYLKYKNGSFPVSESTTNEILSLPIYPEMTNSDVEYVIQNIKNFFNK